MLFAVMALDKAGIAEKRKAVHAQHIAHVKSVATYGIAVVAGGPLVNDDNSGSIGSMMLLEAPDRAAIEKFNRDDPFHKNGIWDKVEVRRFDRKE
jgi:hypothetical protein